MSAIPASGFIQLAPTDGALGSDLTIEAAMSASPGGRSPLLRVVATSDPRAPGLAVIERFVDRLVDHGATVIRSDLQEIDVTVDRILNEHRAVRIAERSSSVWSRPIAVGPGDGVITTCRMAVAETGTIVLDGGARGGPRILTMLPDLHVCVVRTDQIVPGAPVVLAGFLGTASPVTFIRGRAGACDVSLARVPRMFGPKQIVVVLASTPRPTGVLS